MPSRPAHQRIIARLAPGRSDEDCWLWPGATTSNGYGIVGSYDMSGRQYTELTHRVLYRELVGPVPDGLDLDHLCRTRLCCNPRHLEPVTRLVNAHRGAHYRPAACPHGHAYTPENSYFTPRVAHLRCRECDRQRSAARRAALRAAA